MFCLFLFFSFFLQFFFLVTLRDPGRLGSSFLPWRLSFFYFLLFFSCLPYTRGAPLSSRCSCCCVPVQYYKQSILYKETLHYMNTAFTALFSIECMLKIISFGVKVTVNLPPLAGHKILSMSFITSTHLSCNLTWFLSIFKESDIRLEPANT